MWAKPKQPDSRRNGVQNILSKYLELKVVFSWSDFIPQLFWDYYVGYIPALSSLPQALLPHLALLPDSSLNQMSLHELCDGTKEKLSFDKR